MSFLAAFPGKQVRKERRAAYRASRRAKPLDQRLTETGNAISEFGKSLFWLGVCILFTIFIGAPILISLFK